ncbi:GNAT family N-acetyltransferase [Jeotgalibacillus proteolyticus]|uniref:GNAT family N-acetyltransferase n=1 Tax=Jeotgalibacillus proteolyticus TaxID=2082395 RepID=A0A2S5GGB6_9BACL|nr:GNAT family N-acetyltransferase [Jeotgalibacillus proteolyticus]PPA71964.1 GNAT family N-acetyltransferase [Jeotgalibacillus proteolyticus]
MIDLYREKEEDYSRFLHFLKMADDNEQEINSYIKTGSLWSIRDQESIIGAVLLIPYGNSGLEIKNIALAEEMRGKGTGKSVIERIVQLARNEGYKKLLVGTANSSIETIIFYQKCGFRMKEVKQNYFSHYEPPIFESGIQVLDMIVFELLIS